MKKGLWWVTTDQSPPIKANKLIHLEGDPRAWQRNWTQIWRWQWRWHLFEVDLESIEESNATAGYNVYFATEGDCARYWTKITTKYFFARLGPETTSFWVATGHDSDYQPLSITHLGSGTRLHRRVSHTWQVPDQRSASRQTLCNMGLATKI